MRYSDKMLKMFVIESLVIEVSFLLYSSVKAIFQFLTTHIIPTPSIDIYVYVYMYKHVHAHILYILTSHGHLISLFAQTYPPVKHHIYLASESCNKYLWFVFPFQLYRSFVGHTLPYWGVQEVQLCSTAHALPLEPYSCPSTFST